MARVEFACVTSPPPEATTSVLVIVDVFRSTTTAQTAVDRGFRCYPVTSVEHARTVASGLDAPVLAGEIAGVMPQGFDINNSPTAVSRLPAGDRSIVLLSSSGSALMCEAATNGGATLVASLRNWRAAAEEAIATQRDVFVLAAATRGELREEDAYCGALIIEALADAGVEPSDAARRVVDGFAGLPVDVVAGGRSAAYLRDSGQEEDVRFVLDHVGDLPAVFRATPTDDTTAEIVRVSVRQPTASRLER